MPDGAKAYRAYRFSNLCRPDKALAAIRQNKQYPLPFLYMREGNDKTSPKDFALQDCDSSQVLPAA
ncbi:TPA: hypothetical protein JD342_02910 [Citrobacter freundii]|nr:hypothetical protein [Citrobacter freundii]